LKAAFFLQQVVPSSKILSRDANRPIGNNERKVNSGKVQKRKNVKINFGNGKKKDVTPFIY